jgi:flagella basal body P-ring formation protein FlgA
MRPAQWGQAIAWFLILSGPAGGEAILAPGELLTRPIVAELVREALADRDIRSDLSVEVQTPAAPLPNRAATPVHIAVTELHFDPRTGRYEAQLLARLATGESSAIASVGRVQELVEVPVLARAVQAGETILPQDLVLRRLPADTLRGNFLQSAEDLAGLQAARPLMAGRILRTGDLVVPLLIRRGEQVTMTFSLGALQLIGVGVALDHGRRGETIQVQNPTSGEIRRAMVVGQRRVVVDPLPGGMP